MSKKIMSVMLAIFMLASLCVVGLTSASAANTGYIVPTVTGEGEKGAKAGDEVHVILKVSNLDGRYGVNGEINTYFDDTKLEFVKPTTDAEISAIAPAVAEYVPNFNLDGTFKDSNGYMGVHINFSSATKGYNYEAHDGVVVDYTFKALTDIENLNDAVYMDIVCLGIFDAAGSPMISGNYNYTNVATADNFGNYGSVSTNGGTWNPTATEPPVQIDVTALVARIADAKALAAKTDVYTAESIAALNDAITAAEAVAANPESQDQVDAQVAALQSAMDALEKVQGPVEINTTALEALIADAKALAAKTDVYTAESIAALNDAITDAEAVAANPESQDQVDAQVAALQTAMDALVTIDSSEEPSSSSEEPSSSSEEPSSSNEPATTEKPEAPQTGEASTAVALMVVAIMAAGVVIFARKKATK